MLIAGDRWPTMPILASSWNFGIWRRKLRFRDKHQLLNADEAGHCTDTARTKLGCHPERSEGGQVQKCV